MRKRDLFLAHLSCQKEQIDNSVLTYTLCIFQLSDLYAHWACKFLIPNLTISLQHCCFISSLCMLYKIFHNPSHPLHSELPNLFHPRRVTRGSLSINSLSFSPMRFHTSQYSRCFIPATTKLWNELPSMIVQATELQKFKIGANAFLLGVDGL